MAQWKGCREVELEGEPKVAALRLHQGGNEGIVDCMLEEAVYVRYICRINLPA